ncbi:DNA/RNA nuclease SfsA [Chlorogloeopsis fritschii PCC 9212]|uniref:Sugar fermentation stimulation protein homolog n=1 Tax=Chlorogloeopsis fritschii PCC 6912 TaxID=211165 RepID=A0A3S1AKU9_CHLFR|nr:DNA/RNA nuclease SfsA [Chlorogloeopsis fritschii]RUR83187.1 sugar fermentation stimulation protein [Chlorogloeopsis fritschii PCC 6912]
MTTDYLYRYPPLYSGILLRRYKRFFADVELASGEIVTAHCPNTGPMTGVCIPGNAVQLSKSDSPNRKLAYTWEMIQVYDNEPTWVGVNTALPNRIIKLALEKNLFPELGEYSQIRGEVVYGQDKKSRVDFFLSSTPPENQKLNQLQLVSDSNILPQESATKDSNLLLIDKNRPIYLEIKNTTWAQGKLSLFPDTETTRGQKHLRELMALLPQYRAVMLYFINRGDCDEFAPGDRADPVYGKLLGEALALGLEVLPCRFEVSPIGVRYLGLAKLKI